MSLIQVLVIIILALTIFRFVRLILMIRQAGRENSSEEKSVLTTNIIIHLVAIVIMVYYIVYPVITNSLR